MKRLLPLFLILLGQPVWAQTDWGAVDNTNATGPRFNLTLFSGGTLSESGSLDSVTVHQGRFSTAGRFNVAVYQGGTSGDITGAALIWESGEQNSPAGPAWITVSAGGESLNADETWIAVSVNEDGDTYEAESPDNGDLDLNLFRWDTNYSTGTFPATAPASDAVQTSSAVVKGYITYSTGGAGVTSIPIIMHHRNQMEQ